MTQKSPSGHHPTNLSGYIFATKAKIGKNVKQQYLLHMCAQYGELLPTSGWDIFSGIWGTPATVNGFRVLAALVVGVSQSLRR